MSILRYFIFSIALIALTSCENEIEFEYKDIPEQLVIEGLLTNEGVSVCLTKTVPTDEPFNKNTIKDASVIIWDKTDGETVALIPDTKGNFSSEGFVGQSGHEYELTVTFENNIYTSTSRMLSPSEIVSAEFNWIRMPYDDVAVLKVKFTEAADKFTHYWLRVYRNGKPYEWQAIGSRNAMDGCITGMMMTSRKDIDQEDEQSVLKDGDIIDIEVMPISKRMADYLDSLNNGDYNGDRMFDGPYCLGYFLAAPITKTRLIYHPQQIPYAD